MRGTVEIPFNLLFIDTVKFFGVKEAWYLYCGMGMHRWEFRFWMRSCWAQIKGE